MMRRLAFAVTAFLVAVALASQVSAYPSDPKTGVTILDSEKVYPGYVLFTPLLGDDSVGTESVVYLINVNGDVVHTWAKENKPGEYAQLLPNGNLMYSGISEKDVTVPPGDGGLLEEIDWDGNVVWSYENDYIHHDFEVLPDGDVAALVYAKIPPSLAEQVQGGVPDTGLEDGSMWSDSIIEVSREGEVDWTWNAWEHLGPATDAIHPDINRHEWTHANSLRYVAADPVTGSEAYLVSFRQISTIALIDRESGDIIWKWGPGVLSHQHDARLLDNGNILVFDNGEDPRDTATGHILPRSRVVEVDPRQDGGTIVWEYQAAGLLPWRFFSPIISGAQRLSNGNTLITEGVPGRLFEVTQEGEIVWEYMSPYGNLIDDGPSRETWIFKALKYSPDEIDFPETMPGPLERLSADQEGQAEQAEVSAEQGVELDGVQDVAPESELVAAEEGDGGDLAWWQGVLIGVGAGLSFFAVGFVAARRVTGH